MKKEEILKFYLVYKLFIFPAIIVLSSLILIAFVIYPQITKLIVNQKTQDEIFNKSNFLEAKAQTLESYDPNDLSIKVNYALAAYPIDKDFLSAIGLLQNLAAASGFNIGSISLGGGEAKSGVSQSYGVKLEIVGPASLLSTLLNNIENTSRIMRISSVATSLAKDVQSGTTSLLVEVLYAAAPAGFGSVDSPLPQISQKEEEIIAKLAKSGGVTITPVQQPQAPVQLGPRGRDNPFE